MASLLYDLDIGSTYNFTLLAPGILTAGYNSAVVSAVLDYATAITLADVTGLHAAALNVLPSGTPASPAGLIYYKLTTNIGETAVIAQNWIATPPVLVQATTAIFTISNISTADVPTITNLLKANGFQSFVVS